MDNLQKNLILSLVIAVVLGVVGFFMYKEFLATDSFTEDPYSSAISQIQQLKNTDTQFDLGVLSSDEFLKLKKNGKVPVQPQTNTGRDNPFAYPGAETKGAESKVAQEQ